MDKYLVVWYYTTEESKKWTIRHTLKHTQNKEDKNYYLEIPFRQFKIAFKYIFLIFFLQFFWISLHRHFSVSYDYNWNQTMWNECIIKCYSIQSKKMHYIKYKSYISVTLRNRE